MKAFHLTCLLLLAGCYTKTVTNSVYKPYIFGRPFFSGSFSGPRGGTTTGPDVELTSSPTQAWRHLREKGISSYEQDKRAILAMVGDYRVSFEFLETIAFTPGYELATPYRSWATETIIPIATDKNFISLQHILIMSFQEQDGTINGPHVIKHWRQDWRYQPETFTQYLGNNQWQNRKIEKNQRPGVWSQEVFQVDDAPRYGAIGKWKHHKRFSEWVSDATTRPLPRREYSIRNDYSLLEGINRVVILPTGWIHEQKNLKCTSGKLISEEIGINRYQHLVHFDASAGIDYWKRTRDTWARIRNLWSTYLQVDKTVTVKNKVDGVARYEILFDAAEKRFEDSLLKEQLDHYISSTHSTTMEFKSCSYTVPEK